MRRRRRRALVSALLVLLVGAGTWFTLDARQRAAATRREAEATSALERQVRNLPFPRPAGQYSAEEREQLKARHAQVAKSYEIITLRADSGLGSVVAAANAACEFRRSEAEVAWAEGDLAKTLDRLKAAAAEADQFVRISQARAEFGLDAADVVATARKVQADAAIALARMQKIVAPK